MPAHKTNLPACRMPSGATRRQRQNAAAHATLEDMNTIVKVSKPEPHTMLLSSLLTYRCGRNGARINYIHSDRTWDLYQDTKTMLAAVSDDPQFPNMTPNTVTNIANHPTCAPGWYAILKNTDGIKDHKPGQNLIHVMIPYYDIIDYTDDHVAAIKTLGYENAARLSALIHYPSSPLPKTTRKQLYKTAISYAKNDRLPWLLSVLAENMGGLTLEEIVNNDTLPAEFIRVDSDRIMQQKEDEYRKTGETLANEGNAIFGRIASRLYRNGVADGAERSLMFSALLETFGYQPLPKNLTDVEKVNGAYTNTPKNSIIIPNDKTMLTAKKRNPTTGTIRRRLNDLHRIEALPDIILGCFPNRPPYAGPRAGHAGLLLEAEEQSGMYVENNLFRYTAPSARYMFHEFHPWESTPGQREPATRLDWLEHLLDMDDEDEQYRQIMWIRMRQTAAFRIREPGRHPVDPTPNELNPWVKEGIPPKELSWKQGTSISFPRVASSFDIEGMIKYGGMDEVFAELPTTVAELQQRLKETGAASGDELYCMIFNNHWTAEIKADRKKRGMQ